MSLGLASLINGEERRSLVLIVDDGVDVELCDFSHFVEAEHLLNILVKRGRANRVQILANFNFFLGQSVELLIMQAHVHSIVDVGPLGRVIDLMAIVGVSLHEVAGLDKVIKKELLLHCSIFSLGPAGA